LWECCQFISSETDQLIIFELIEIHNILVVDVGELLLTILKDFLAQSMDSKLVEVWLPDDFVEGFDLPVHQDLLMWNLG